MPSLSEIFQILMVIVFLGCAVLLLIKIKFKLDIPEQKWFFIGLFGFFLCWAVMELMYYLSPSYAIDPSGYEFFYKIAYSFGVAALLSILLVIERYAVPKSKFIFSIITLVGLIFIIVLPLEGESIAGARLASYIFLPIGAASIVLLYIYLLFKLSGKLRRETGIILFGIALVITGYLFDTNIFDSIASGIPYWDAMCSLIMIVGGLIVAITYYRRQI